MHSYFVSYLVANEVIDLGFKERCPGHFTILGSVEVEEGWSQVGTSSDQLPAPTFSQVQDWFLKEYNLFSTIEWYGDSFNYGFKVISKFTDKVVIMKSKIEDYNAAKNALLLSMINYIKRHGKHQ